MKSNNSYEQNARDNIVDNEFPAYIRMLESCFDFERWGLKQFFSGDVPQSSPSVVYESEQCRVRFMWEVPDMRDSSEITYILYGRLHAPIEQRFMVWNGEKCYCWHEIDRVLEFLDNLSPQEAFKRRFALPPFMQEFYETNQDKGWRQSEFRARIHAATWNNYGQKLFDVFDLRKPEQWQKYTNFLIEYYRLWSDFVADPAMYKIC